MEKKKSIIIIISVQITTIDEEHKKQQQWETISSVCIWFRSDLRKIEDRKFQKKKKKAPKGDQKNTSTKKFLLGVS